MVGHGEEVAYTMYKLLKASNNYSEDEILRLTEIAMFHDIGAYKVEERNKLVDIDLEKPMAHAVYGSLFIKYLSPLSDLSPVILGHHMFPKDLDEEYEKIKDHAIIGYKILSDLGINDLRDIATLHHEKLDGTGYPFGLKEDEISFEVRIVAIADVVSALVNRRSYKGEFSKEEVISILSDMASNNKIDSGICNLVIDNYDLIINKVSINTKKMLNLYNNLLEEYELFLNCIKRLV